MRNYINEKIGAFHETLLHHYAGTDNANQNKTRCEFLIENGAEINAKDYIKRLFQVTMPL